jgi:hypothetical protein
MCFFDKLLNQMWDNENLNHIQYLFYEYLNFVYIVPYYCKQNVVVSRYIEIEKLRF